MVRRATGSVRAPIAGVGQPAQRVLSLGPGSGPTALRRPDKPVDLNLDGRQALTPTRRSPGRPGCRDRRCRPSVRSGPRRRDRLARGRPESLTLGRGDHRCDGLPGLASRGHDALEALLGEDPGRDQVIISECFPIYARAPNRQLCWAHLRRDFQAMIDRASGGEPVGQARGPSSRWSSRAGRSTIAS